MASQHGGSKEEREFARKTTFTKLNNYPSSMTSSEQIHFDVDLSLRRNKM